MSWILDETMHSHEEDGEWFNDVAEEDQHTQCLVLVCNGCKAEHEIANGVIGHWPNSEEGKSDARDVAGDTYHDEVDAWYFRSDDESYCSTCRQTVVHEHEIEKGDDVCWICLDE